MKTTEMSHITQDNHEDPKEYQGSYYARTLRKLQFLIKSTYFLAFYSILKSPEHGSVKLQQLHFSTERESNT